VQGVEDGQYPQDCEEHQGDQGNRQNKVLSRSLIVSISTG